MSIKSFFGVTMGVVLVSLVFSSNTALAKPLESDPKKAPQIISEMHPGDVFWIASMDVKKDNEGNLWLRDDDEVYKTPLFTALKCPKDVIAYNTRLERKRSGYHVFMDPNGWISNMLDHWSSETFAKWDFIRVKKLHIEDMSYTQKRHRIIK